MKRASMISIALLAILSMLGGCAGKGPVGAGVPSAAKLETHPQDDRALLYVNPDASKKTYSKFIIEPVQIYHGGDHGIGDIPMEDRQGTGSTRDTGSRNGLRGYVPAASWHDR